MIEVTKLRAGVNFAVDGVPYRAVKYEHTHMSRGGGTVRIKARSLKDGSVANLTYKSTAFVEDIEVVRKKMQYLYADGETLIFMDPTTFEQKTLKQEIAGNQAKFLVEGEEVWVVMWEDSPAEEQGKILDLDLPASLVMEIGETGPNVKGNSATNVFKPATLTNGLVIRVPLFMKVGEKVKVDTRSGEYIERVSE